MKRKSIALLLCMAIMFSLAMPAFAATEYEAVEQSSEGYIDIMPLGFDKLITKYCTVSEWTQILDDSNWWSEGTIEISVADKADITGFSCLVYFWENDNWVEAGAPNSVRNLPTNGTKVTYTVPLGSHFLVYVYATGGSSSNAKFNVKLYK